MIYKKSALALSILILLSFTNPASADTLSELKAQLQAVLTRIDALKAELAIVESSPTTPSTGPCLNITTNLRKGMQSSDVKKLQIFLAKDPTIYPEGITSGYYGTLTERAVQRWQATHGVVNSGTPSTTGYGAVGPKTRKAMAESCSGGTTGTAPGVENVIDFAFINPSGNAPYDATARLVTLESECMSYKIDWGDTTEPTTYAAPKTTSCGYGTITRNLMHTYTTSGNYTATLYAGKGPVNTLQKVKDIYIAINPGAPTVRILSPNGGEVLRLGERTDIKWLVANQPVDSAVLFYIVAPDGTYRFAKKTQDKTSFTWLTGEGVCDGNSCNVSLTPGSNYKLRATLYTPANACTDRCTSQDVMPTFISTDESDATFTISQLGSGGSDPLVVRYPNGNAPYTAGIQIKIEPIAGGGIGNFELDFGDGSPEYNVYIPAGETRTTIKNIAHTYAYPGTYTMILRPLGSAQVLNKQTINVTEWTTNIKPATEGYAPETVELLLNIDTTCTTDSGTTREYTIDWGDNTETTRYVQTLSQCSTIPTQTSTTMPFTHNYLDSGTFNITVTTKVGGVRSKINKFITIKKPTLSISPQFGFNPLTVTAKYAADNTCAVTPTTATYTIDWGDGNDDTYTKQLPQCTDTQQPTTITKQFTHKYTSLGRYNTTLTVTKTGIGSVTSSRVQVVVDKSVLRNGWRVFANMIDNSAANIASAVNSLF